MRDALGDLDPLWDELFPAEQARIVRLLVERVEVGPGGADIRLRVAGLASLVRDLGATAAGGGVSEPAASRCGCRSRSGAGRGGRRWSRPAAMAPVRTRADPALLKALARAFRWQRLLDEGRYASISELAAAEKIERGYLGKVLRLTLLAPEWWRRSWMGGRLG